MINLSSYTVSPPVKTKFLFLPMMIKSVIMITAFDESARDERIYAQTRLNAQNINVIEDNYEEEPQVINCNFEIIYGNRRVGPHNPGKIDY